MTLPGFAAAVVVPILGLALVLSVVRLARGPRLLDRIVALELMTSCTVGIAVAYREDNGASGHRSLLALLAVSAVVGFLWSRSHQSVINPMIGRQLPAPPDEVLILSMTVASFTALILALANRLLGLKLLSKLTERVTFVLIPPLVLIFLVLGTIFLGIATPTEGGALGAMGALIMAVSRRKLSLDLLQQALTNTTKLSCFVLFILIGSTVFSFTFNAAEGHIWVEHLFANRAA